MRVYLSRERLNGIGVEVEYAARRAEVAREIMATMPKDDAEICMMGTMRLTLKEEGWVYTADEVARLTGRSEQDIRRLCDETQVQIGKRAFAQYGHLITPAFREHCVSNQQRQFKQKPDSAPHGTVD